MQALKAVENNNCIIPYTLGSEIGYGQDGQVFELIDNSNQVIKISILYDTFDIHHLNYYKQISNAINYLIDNSICSYARVYAYEYLGTFNRQFINTKQNYILYYYVLEKLNKISEDEKKVFHTILSHEDRSIDKNYSISQIKKILNDLNRGLDFDVEKIIFFYEQMQQSPIEHLDLHPRNIMKNDIGDYKLIDFDRIKLK